MPNLSRNTTPTSSNLSRGDVIEASHLFDETNTPFDPDTNLPFQDEATSVEYSVSGTPLSRNSTPSGTNLTRN